METSLMDNVLMCVVYVLILALVGLCISLMPRLNIHDCAESKRQLYIRRFIRNYNIIRRREQ